jgi:hypothetical protein
VGLSCLCEWKLTNPIKDETWYNLDGIFWTPSSRCQTMSLLLPESTSHQMVPSYLANCRQMIRPLWPSTWLVSCSKSQPATTRRNIYRSYMVHRQCNPLSRVLHGSIDSCLKVPRMVRGYQVHDPPGRTLGAFGRDDRDTARNRDANALKASAIM